MARDRREAEALTAREARLAADQGRGESELADLQARQSSVDSGLAAVEQDAATREQAVNEAVIRVAREEEATAGALAILEGLQARLVGLREHEAETAADVERARGLLARLQVEAEAATEQLAIRLDELQRTTDGLPADLVRLDDEALQRRLVRSLRELRNVGSVDYGVLAERRALEDRYTYLTEQLDDLARTEVAIREGMEEARQRIQGQFSSAFDQVNERFKELFRELFRGGDAELLLTGDPDRPQSGVDIVAQPPGKRLHRLATLSGGERALVGAALLLALISANPSPFCMLDEVDAALDEANVQRFVGTVREMARETQFILVTHNRATMETADALYGVTMNPGAVSQVLAIRLPG
jgi:chromosome segregation protein